MILPQSSASGCWVSSYELLGSCIRIEHNCLDWLSSTADFLCLPETDDQRPADIRLSFFEVDGEDEANRIIPVPDAALQQNEYLLQLNRAVPCRSYIDSPRRWVELGGYGRTWVDYSLGTATVLRYRNCGIDRVYDHLLFSFNLLNNLLAKLKLYAVHAACIRVGDKGMLITGDSGSGKSTAAFAMLQAGQAVLSDERVLLFKKDVIGAAVISDVIKLNRTAMRDLFPEAENLQTFWQTPDECYFKTGAIDHFRHSPLTTVKYLIVLEKSGTLKSRLERMHPARTVEHLFPVTLNAFEPWQLAGKFHFLAGVLAQVECYRVWFGTDMQHFSETIMNLAAS